MGLSLKRAHPTCESHCLKAATRLEKGSALDGVVVMGRVMGGKEEEGKWRKPEKKRRKKAVTAL